MFTLDGVLTVGQMRGEALDLAEQRLHFAGLCAIVVGGARGGGWRPPSRLWRHSAALLYCTVHTVALRTTTTSQQQSRHSRSPFSILVRGRRRKGKP